MERETEGGVEGREQRKRGCNGDRNALCTHAQKIYTCYAFGDLMPEAEVYNHLDTSHTESISSDVFVPSCCILPTHQTVGSTGNYCTSQRVSV